MEPTPQRRELRQPLDAPTFAAWARGAWACARGRDGGVRALRALDVLVAALVAYVVVTTFMRFFYMFMPWTMEGDWKQWIWQYHRYWTDGAFPPGHVVTDYQFRVQPPLYYVVMASLSHVMPPGFAARLLALVAWGLTLLGAYRATTRLSHWFMGLVALVFLAHDLHLFTTTMGGYPRSFGPALVVLALDAWLARRHVRVLAILVVMAALYPSVLPPVGLAYGAWTFFASLRQGARSFAFHTGTLVVTAAVCAGLALSQNLLALEWWGHVITMEEAQQLPALQPGGRMRWLPLGNYWRTVSDWVLHPWQPSGAVVHYGVLPWPQLVPQLAGALVCLALLAVVVVKRRRPPWEALALIAGALVAYFAARELAFRLYLPVRVLHHVVPITMVVAVPVLAWEAARALASAAASLARACVLACAAVLAPLFALAGDGLLFPGWGSYDYRAPHLSWIRDETPVDALFAGDIATSDLIPYFCARQVFVNWTMAHPFRLGYWREQERRLLRVHELMYAVDRAEVLRIVDEEGIDFIVLDPARFTEPDTGRKLFHPIREPVLRMFRERKGRFVLAAPPPSAIAYRDDAVVIVDARALRAAWSAAPAR